MSTEQSYVGRGTIATSSHPFTQKATFGLDPSLLADSRPIPLARINEAQHRLLTLVDRFAARGNYAPLQAANDLLQYWLSTPVKVLAKEADKDQFHAVLLLIDSLSEVYPISNLPTLNSKGQTVEPIALREKYTARLSPALLDRFNFTDEEEDRAGLIPVPDDSMAPQLYKGAQIVVTALERVDYHSASGVVVAVMQYAQNRPLMGRVAFADKCSILLVRDNPLFTEETLLVSEIHFLASVRYVLNQPVL